MKRLGRACTLSTALLTPTLLIAAELLFAPGAALANHQFSDVPTSASYHDFVDFLVDNGITGGCGPGLYCPGNAVTRAQMAIFLERVALFGGCSPDMVKVGPACIDRYEASLWKTQNAALIAKIRRGTVAAADLLPAVATPLGLVAGDLAAAGCPRSGSGCVDVYAVSLPGVTPAKSVTWFQAAAAARNAWKRLPTNAEWQAAALGAPSDQCNISSGLPASTGAAGDCVSDVGAFDMVGNLWEWVADWVPRSTASGSWGSFSDDFQTLAGAATSGPPGALTRGGSFSSGASAGPFAVRGNIDPSVGDINLGFRAAR